jgi:hypothetical protein
MVECENEQNSQVTFGQTIIFSGGEWKAGVSYFGINMQEMETFIKTIDPHSMIVREILIK